MPGLSEREGSFTGSIPKRVRHDLLRQVRHAHPRGQPVLPEVRRQGRRDRRSLRAALQVLPSLQPARPHVLPEVPQAAHPADEIRSHRERFRLPVGQGEPRDAPVHRAAPPHHPGPGHGSPAEVDAYVVAGTGDQGREPLEAGRPGQVLRRDPGPGEAPGDLRDTHPGTQRLDLRQRRQPGLGDHLLGPRGR